MHQLRLESRVIFRYTFSSYRLLPEYTYSINFKKGICDAHVSCCVTTRYKGKVVNENKRNSLYRKNVSRIFSDSSYFKHNIFSSFKLENPLGRRRAAFFFHSCFYTAQLFILFIEIFCLAHEKKKSSLSTIVNFINLFVSLLYRDIYLFHHK